MHALGCQAEAVGSSTSAIEFPPQYIGVFAIGASEYSASFTTKRRVDSIIGNLAFFCNPILPKRDPIAGGLFRRSA
jgi:hypothetical protein